MPDTFLGGGMGFVLTAHACRHCGARVVQSGDMFRCSSCAAIGMRHPATICGCGTVAPGKGRARFQCVVNPTPTPANPAYVLIEVIPELPMAAE